jgi:hypothetical protein
MPAQVFTVCTQRALPPGYKASHAASVVQTMHWVSLTHPTPAETPTAQMGHGSVIRHPA